MGLFKLGTRPNTALQLAPFQEHIIEIASTGQKISLLQTDNIAKVLNKAGYVVPLSCEHGICGTCTLRYTEGELHHQDMILNDEDHLTMFTPCCSKMKSKHIVIDL